MTSAGEQSNDEALQRRLQLEELERDGSDSSCSESISGNAGGAFQPASSCSSKDGSTGLTATTSYPTPNISVGPPIHPPPHLLPYLYPHGLYPPTHLGLLHNPAATAVNPTGLNPGLIFNAQLALAAQHPALFGHYSGHPPAPSLQGLKSHRFSPYSLPGSLGSAFDAVTPGSSANRSGAISSDCLTINNMAECHERAVRSLSSSPRPRASSHSPSTRPISISPTISPTMLRQANSPTELKSIENMVNGLDVQQNGNSVGSVEELPGKSPDIQTDQ